MIIRPETPDDYLAIHRINIAAFADHPFSRQTEHLIVDALRDASALTLSLVAEDQGQVIGHIAFSSALIDGVDQQCFLLGPVAVPPERQRQGVGSQLVEYGLSALRQQGAHGCVLVGDPNYYERFGFRRNPDLIVPGVPAEYVLCLPLTNQMPHGLVTHHPAFSMTATLALTMELIRRPSITPDDAGCQELLSARLAALGFRIERLRFGEVDNCWARYGDVEPLFAFAGHTDVVPPGPLDQWQSAPFTPEIHDGNLYGRGAADMKGSLAAMLTAVERFLSDCPQSHGSLAFLLTSDEEGAAVNGTVKVVEELERRGEKIRWCLVGEPSCTAQLGDTIKIGRRGSLNGRLILRGVQGHVAYPHLAQNPLHAIGPLLTALADQVWDQGDAHFPPTSFQMSNLHGGTGAVNVIPGDLELLFNFRFSPAVTVEQLQERTRLLIETSLLNEEIKTGQVFQYDLSWSLSGMPFFTPPGELVAAAADAIHAETSQRAELSTSGGTSDGRFIAPTGAQVIELGPLNATIHKINEQVAVDDLERLSRIYQGILTRLLA